MPINLQPVADRRTDRASFTVESQEISAENGVSYHIVISSTILFQVNSLFRGPGFQVILVAVLTESFVSVWTAELEVRHHSGKKCVVKRRNSTHAPQSHRNRDKQLFLREPKIKEDASDTIATDAPDQSETVTGAPGRIVVVQAGSSREIVDEEEATSTLAPFTTSITLATTSDTQGQFFGMGKDDFDSDTLSASSSEKSASQVSTAIRSAATTTNAPTAASTTITTKLRPSTATRSTTSTTTTTTPVIQNTTARKLPPVQLEGSTRPQPFRDHAAARVTLATVPITIATMSITSAATTHAKTRRTVTSTTTSTTTAEATTSEALASSSNADSDGSESDDSAITTVETTITTAPSTAATSTSRRRQTKAQTQSKATTTTTTAATSTARTTETPTTEASTEQQSSTDNQDVPSALETADKEKRQEHKVVMNTVRPTRKRTPRRLEGPSETGNVLLNIAEVADKDDTTGLQRVNGPGTPLLDGSYLSDPWMCRVNKSVVRSPIIMKTCQGEEKQIVDLRVYKLSGIPIEECVTTPVVLGDRCTSLNGGHARCAQRYVRYGLIAKALDSDKKAHECFRFPSACLCQIILSNSADTSPADDVGRL